MMKLNRVELTAAQKKLWSDTRVALMWDAPAFSSILFNMLDNVSKNGELALFTDDPGIPIAATDGSALIINPEGYFKLDLKEREFVAAHEIMHCIFNHCIMGVHWQLRGKIAYDDGTELDYYSQLMNVAMDYVINDGLVQSKLGTMPKVGCHDVTKGTHMESVIDVYRKLYEEAEKRGKGMAGKFGPPGSGPGSGFDKLMDPGTTTGQDKVTASQQRNEAEWKAAIQQAADSARLQGNLPLALERMLDAFLNPQIDWRDKIQTLFARRLGTGTYDWRKPDRRFIIRDIYSPARSGFGAGTIVVACDTSGSIGAQELNMFFAEIAGILEDLKPENIKVVWCDAEIHRVDDCDEAGDLNTIRYKGAPGGGGTSFVPVFEWMEEEGLRPEALVYLTDGYGSFPNEQPSYPVIWGSISPKDSVKYPFGDVVDIPQQAT